MLKLPRHNRYDYSSIEKRPDFDWPGGKRLAFYVALNVEQFAFLAGRGADPTQRGGPQTQRNYAWRDYGLRVAIWRIFRMLDELQLPATILLNSLICETVPDIVERIKRRGDDVCAHGRSNAEALGGLWEHDEATIIAAATETLTRHFGERPTGWMGPGAAESRVTSDLIKEAGYTHNLGWQVDELVEQSAEQPLVMSVSLHTFITGQPFRLRPVRRALQHCIEHKLRDRVWYTRAVDIANYCFTLPPGTIVGS